MQFNYSLIPIALLVWLELTSLLTTVFIGSPQWVTPLVLGDFITHNFWKEILLALTLSAWLTLSIIGILKKGFLRVVSLISLEVLITLNLIFYLGYAVFSWIILNHFSALAGLIHIFWQHYQNPSLWHRFMQVECIVFLIGLSCLALLAFERLRPARKILGNAHFANGFETKKAGFFKKEEQSIIIGKKYGAPLYSNGFEHVLVFAPTGSGKTRSIGIPNLFNYPYSIVCNDVKLTLFQTTSGFREQVLGHTCYCWAPTSEERLSHCYNSLLLISEDTLQRITDIQRIAHILMPDNKKSDPIWQQASRKLFKVVLLYLLDTPERPTTFGEINRLVKQADFDTWLASTLENTAHLDPEFYRNGFSYLNNHEKTRSDAEYISKLLGTRTTRVASGSVSYQAQGHSQSQSYSYQATPLLRPDELMRLSSEINLILRTGHAPVKAQQYIWYQQKDMKHLVMQSSHVPKQTLAHHPFVHALPSESLEFMET